MIRAAVVGLGKMGLSHHSILNTHPGVRLAAVCDTSAYLLDVLAKYTGVRCFRDYRKLVEETPLDCLIVATPTSSHAEIVRHALARGLHVFVEKPLSLDPAEGRELAGLAQGRGLVCQVGYHYRFIAAFQEARRLLVAGAIGEVHSFRVEAYGAVVLRTQGGTWRARRAEGGGCLFDYASHAIDLVNYLFGRPASVGGTVLHRIFSRDVEDEVYATLHYPNGLSGQLAANWSDESYRRMSMKVTAWGKAGKLVADRQECQLYRRETGAESEASGWSVRYTTELTPPVWFYLRGEEYSSQLDHFVRNVRGRDLAGVNSFASALQTDEVIAMLIEDAGREGVAPPPRAGWASGGALAAIQKRWRP